MHQEAAAAAGTDPGPLPAPPPGALCAARSVRLWEPRNNRCSSGFRARKANSFFTFPLWILTLTIGSRRRQNNYFSPATNAGGNSKSLASGDIEAGEAQNLVSPKKLDNIIMLMMALSFREELPPFAVTS